jgi:hypothetical protein
MLRVFLKIALFRGVWRTDNFDRGLGGVLVFEIQEVTMFVRMLLGCQGKLNIFWEFFG